MTYKNYYEILEIEYPSNPTAIKKGYKKAAIKWHPDRNLDIDTTTQMQNINEAYLILKDSSKKKAYDSIYEKVYGNNFESEFKESNRGQESTKQNETKQKSKAKPTFNEEKLKDWILDAQKRAKTMVYETVEESKSLLSQTFYNVITAFVGFGIIWGIFKIISYVYWTFI